jgi:ribosomal protein S18 acetylase RimI-like enzyme
MIRTAAVDEADVLADLHVRCWQETYAGIMPASYLANLKAADRVETWRSLLVMPDRFVQVAGAEPCGFVMSGPRRASMPDHADGEIYSIYLLQAAQGQGLGKTMFLAAQSDWRDRGGQALQLSVASANVGARRFYERMGGVAVGQGSFQAECQQVPEVIYRFTLDQVRA